MEWNVTITMEDFGTSWCTMLVLFAVVLVGITDYIAEEMQRKSIKDSKNLRMFLPDYV